MKLTDSLKKWLRENKSLPAETSDDDYRKAAAESLVDGSLDHGTYVELTKDADADRATSFEATLMKILENQQASNSRLEALEKTKAAPGPAPQSKAAETAPRLPGGGKVAMGIAASDESSSGSAVNVVEAHKQYDDTRRSLTYPLKNLGNRPHPLAGRQVFEGDAFGGGRAIDQLSNLDRAIQGAYFKWALEADLIGRGQGRQGVPHGLKVTDHDRQLVEYALRDRPWGGVIKSLGGPNGTEVHNRRLNEIELKAVLDDATSGGLEIAPIVFDDAIIQIPLLNGEFFPLVEVVNIARGR
jgi:hypothetical protein